MSSITPREKNGMPGPRAWPSSIPPLVLMSRAPRSTVSAFFMWLPEPRSSPAPHFDGQRWLSVGRFQTCAPAARGMDSKATEIAMRFMVLPLVENFVQAFVVERARHPGELVPELALVRRHAVRVEGVARAPHFEHGEVVRTVGLLHDLEANVAGRRAARLPQSLQRDAGVVLLRRGEVGRGQAVNGRGSKAHPVGCKGVVEKGVPPTV